MPLARDTGVPTSVIHSLSITYNDPTPALAGQLIGWDGNRPTGATPIMGVLQDDATQGKVVSVAMAGLAEVLSGAAVAIGTTVGSDATGKGATVAGGTQSIGKSMSAATAANQKIQVYITREGTN
jgi:hypothetical protein